MRKGLHAGPGSGGSSTEAAARGRGVTRYCSAVLSDGLEKDQRGVLPTRRSIEKEKVGRRLSAAQSFVAEGRPAFCRPPGRAARVWSQLGSRSGCRERGSQREKATHGRPWRRPPPGGSLPDTANLTSSRQAGRDQIRQSNAPGSIRIASRRSGAARRGLHVRDRRVPLPNLLGKLPDEAL